MFHPRCLLVIPLAVCSCARPPAESAQVDWVTTRLGDPTELHHAVVTYATPARGVLVPEEAHHAAGRVAEAWRSYADTSPPNDSHTTFLAAARSAGLLDTPTEDPVLGMIGLEARLVAAQERWLDALASNPDDMDLLIDLSNATVQVSALEHTTAGPRARARLILEQIDPNVDADLETVVSEGRELFHRTDDPSIRIALAHALSSASGWRSDDLEALELLWQTNTEEIKPEIIAEAALQASFQAEDHASSLRWAKRYAEAIEQRCSKEREAICTDQRADARHSLGQATALVAGATAKIDWQAGLHATAWSCHLAHPTVQQKQSQLTLAWSDGWTVSKVSRTNEITECIASTLTSPNLGPSQQKVEWRLQPPP